MREMLNRCRNTLAESEYAEKNLKEDVETLALRALELDTELARWAGMNVELRQRVAWVTQRGPASVQNM